MANKRDLLDEALSRGVISSEQRVQMEALAKEEATDSEERIKPVGTFNEIFVTVGVALLLSATQGLIGLMLNGMLLTSIVGALIAWGAARYFHQRKRFRLPIIYACLVAALDIVVAVKYGMTGEFRDFLSPREPLSHNVVPLIAGLTALAGGAWHFRIPFLMLPISILFTVIVTYAAKYTDNDMSYRVLLGGSGLAILAVAIRFDLLDPKRITRMSDFAFWSYVVGSPLFVHSLFLSVLIEGGERTMLHGIGWLWVAALAVAVSFVGLLLNRRALILSTLIYVGFVLFRLLSTMGTSPSIIILITLLLIGAYVTSLGSRWVQARRAVMTRLPKSWDWVKRLPPY